MVNESLVVRSSCSSRTRSRDCATSCLIRGCPILAISYSPKVVRRLALNWGVTAILYEGERSNDAMMSFGVQRGHELGYIQSGDVVVATAGISRRTGSTNMIRVLTADD